MYKFDVKTLKNVYAYDSSIYPNGLAAHDCGALHSIIDKSNKCGATITTIENAIFAVNEAGSMWGRHCAFCLSDGIALIEWLDLELTNHGQAPLLVLDAVDTEVFRNFDALLNCKAHGLTKKMLSKILKFWEGDEDQIEIATPHGDKDVLEVSKAYGTWNNKTNATIFAVQNYNCEYTQVFDRRFKALVQVKSGGHYDQYKESVDQNCDSGWVEYENERGEYVHIGTVPIIEA